MPRSSRSNPLFSVRSSANRATSVAWSQFLPVAASSPGLPGREKDGGDGRNGAVPYPPPPPTHHFIPPPPSPLPSANHGGRKNYGDSPGIAAARRAAEEAGDAARAAAVARGCPPEQLSTVKSRAAYKAYVGTMETKLTVAEGRLRKLRSARVEAKAERATLLAAIARAAAAAATAQRGLGTPSPLSSVESMSSPAGKRPLKVPAAPVAVTTASVAAGGIEAKPADRVAYALTPASVSRQCNPEEAAAWKPPTQPLDIMLSFSTSPPSDHELLVGGTDSGTDDTGSAAATAMASGLNLGTTATMPDALSLLSCPSVDEAEEIGRVAYSTPSVRGLADLEKDEVEPAAVPASHDKQSTPQVMVPTGREDFATPSASGSQVASLLLSEHDASVVWAGDETIPDWMMLNDNGESWLSGFPLQDVAAEVDPLPDWSVFEITADSGPELWFESPTGSAHPAEVALTMPTPPPLSTTPMASPPTSTLATPLVGPTSSPAASQSVSPTSIRPAAARSCGRPNCCRFRRTATAAVSTAEAAPVATSTHATECELPTLCRTCQGGNWDEATGQWRCCRAGTKVVVMDKQQRGPGDDAAEGGGGGGTKMDAPPVSMAVPAA